MGVYNLWALESDCSELGLGYQKYCKMKNKKFRIWPVLARNLPLAEIYVKSSHHASSINRDSECQDEESEDNCRQMDAAGISNMSDSDFESALSNISSSALAGDDEEPMIEEEEEEPTSTISVIFMLKCSILILLSRPLMSHWKGFKLTPNGDKWSWMWHAL